MSKSVADRFVAIDHSLFQKPEVLYMKAENGWSQAETVAAVTLWFIHVSKLQKKRLEFTSPKMVDEIAGLEGFADAMVSVGWLLFEGTACVVPCFEERFSIQSKQKLLAANRARASRGSDKPASEPVNGDEAHVPCAKAHVPCAKAHVPCANAHHITEQERTGEDKRSDNNNPAADGGSVVVVETGSLARVGELADAIAARTGGIGPPDRSDLAAALGVLRVSDSAASEIVAKDHGRPDLVWALRECVHADSPAGWLVLALRNGWKEPARGSPRADRDAANQQSKADAVRRLIESEGKT